MIEEEKGVKLIVETHLKNSGHLHTKCPGGSTVENYIHTSHCGHLLEKFFIRFSSFEPVYHSTPVVEADQWDVSHKVLVSAME